MQNKRYCIDCDANIIKDHVNKCPLVKDSKIKIMDKFYIYILFFYVSMFFFSLSHRFLTHQRWVTNPARVLNNK